MEGLAKTEQGGGYIFDVGYSSGIETNKDNLRSYVQRCLDTLDKRVGKVEEVAKKIQETPERTLYNRLVSLGGEEIYA